MMTKDEALKMAIDFMKTLTIDVGIKTWNEKHRKEAIQACKEALEQQEVGDAEIKQMLNDIEYYQKRVEELEQPAFDYNTAFSHGYEAHRVEQELEQPAQEPVAWMKNALDNARDVCKFLDHDMIKEAKAHTKFFWNDLDKIRDFDDNHPAQEPECSNHPDAPHGFCRNASHSAGRYVCECEGWEAEQQSQEPVAWGNPTYNYAVHHKVAPSWQGLSDDEKLAIIRKWKDAHTMREQELIGLGDAIEQALRNKNGI